MKRLAIVGAGVSGLAAAWALRDSDIEVTVVEKSRGVSGRAASRTRHGSRFDFGANYIKEDFPGIRQLLTEDLPSEDLTTIEREVWTFDGAGKIVPGDPEQNRQVRWTYRGGISTLGKLLAEAAGIQVLRESRVASIKSDARQWRLQLESGETLEPGFDAVLLTPPSPQSAAILEAGEMENQLKQSLISALGNARYHRQLCVIMGWHASKVRPGPWHALLNSDRKHSLSWLGVESDKPERIKDGLILVAQMAPGWSDTHYDLDRSVWSERGVGAVATLLGGEFGSPEWTDTHRWGYAHPYEAVDPQGILEGEELGLFFCGDGLVGRGRVGLALQTGLEVAQRIAGNMDSPLP